MQIEEILSFKLKHKTSFKCIKEEITNIFYLKDTLFLLTPSILYTSKGASPQCLTKHPLPEPVKSHSATNSLLLLTFSTHLYLISCKCINKINLKEKIKNAEINDSVFCINTESKSLYFRKRINKYEPSAPFSMPAMPCLKRHYVAEDEYLLVLTDGLEVLQGGSSVRLLEQQNARASYFCINMRFYAFMLVVVGSSESDEFTVICREKGSYRVLILEDEDCMNLGLKGDNTVAMLRGMCAMNKDVGFVDDEGSLRVYRIDGCEGVDEYEEVSVEGLEGVEEVLISDVPEPEGEGKSDVPESEGEGESDVPKTIEHRALTPPKTIEPKTEPKSVTPPMVTKPVVTKPMATEPKTEPKSVTPPMVTKPINTVPTTAIPPMVTKHKSTECINKIKEETEILIKSIKSINPPTKAIKTYKFKENQELKQKLKAVYAKIENLKNKNYKDCLCALIEIIKFKIDEFKRIDEEGVRQSIEYVNGRMGGLRVVVPVCYTSAVLMGVNRRVGKNTKNAGKSDGRHVGSCIENNGFLEDVGFKDDGVLVSTKGVSNSMESLRINDTQGMDMGVNAGEEGMDLNVGGGVNAQGTDLNAQGMDISAGFNAMDLNAQGTDMGVNAQGMDMSVNTGSNTQGINTMNTMNTLNTLNTQSLGTPFNPFNASAPFNPFNASSVFNTPLAQHINPTPEQQPATESSDKPNPGSAFSKFVSGRSNLFKGL